MSATSIPASFLWARVLPPELPIYNEQDGTIYPVFEHLGSGNSSVYASKSGRGSPLALKIVFPTSADRAEYEAGILERIRGTPHILNMRKFFKVDSYGILVMDRLLCRDACEELKKKRLTLSGAEVLEVAKQLSETLDVLHRVHRIVYRDLKLENLCIDRSSVRLFDFDIAANISDIDYRTFTGTELYAPPEALFREFYNESRDIWSLGCILFELYTGEELFYNNPSTSGTLVLVGEQLLSMINQLGMPGQQFIEKLSEPNRTRFFQKRSGGTYYLKNPPIDSPCLTIKPWKERILDACARKGEPLQKAQFLIQLLERMFQWEIDKRPAAWLVKDLLAVGAQNSSSTSSSSSALTERRLRLPESAIRESVPFAEAIQAVPAIVLRRSSADADLMDDQD